VGKKLREEYAREEAEKSRLRKNGEEQERGRGELFSEWSYQTTHNRGELFEDKVHRFESFSEEKNLPMNCGAVH
jgi:hypothetical protein